MSLNKRLINTGGAGGGAATRAYGVGSRKLTVYDISDPSNMSSLGQFTIPNTGAVYSVAIDKENQLAYYTQDQYVYKIDVSDPSNMSIVAQANGIYFDQSYEIAFNASNQTAYVTGRAYNLMKTVNVSNMGHQDRFGFSSPNGVVVYPEQGYGYTANGNDRTIKVINQSTTNCSIVSSLYDADWRNIWKLDIDKETNTLFTLNQFYSSITAVDISNPLSLSKISVVGGSGTFSRGIAVDSTNKVVYTASQNGLRSFDVSNTSSMSLLSTNQLNASPTMYSVRVDPITQVAYIVGNAQLYSVDVSNPSSMPTIQAIGTSSDEYIAIA